MSFMKMGGPFMMPMLVIGLCGLVMLAVAIYGTMKDEASSSAMTAARLTKHIAVFLLVTGVLSQAAGLYQALSAIEAAGDVSPALVAGGLRVSFIAPIFGMIEFLVLIAGYAFVRTRL
jgi:hypothetical protein